MSRHFKFLLVCSLVSAASSGLTQETTTATPLLAVNMGRQFGEGTFPRTAKWQRLVCKELNCQIKEASVRVSTSSAKNVLDEDELLDVLAVQEAAIAVFPNGQFNRGNIPTWYLASDTDARQHSRLKKLGKWHMPWGARPLALSWVRTPDGWLRYHVSDGLTKQFLFRTEAEGHYGGDTTPTIHWVGDLDGDGKLDVLLSIPDDNCGFDERLYLSSNAGDGKLLRKAAQLAGTEAACGC
jgi:hypothetical protein